MFNPIKVVDLELSRPLATFESLNGYVDVQALVRLHGTPIGYVKAPVTAGRCEAETLRSIILKEHSQAITHYLLQNGLAAQLQSEGLYLADLLNTLPLERGGPRPLVTVAVCTRDRTADLALCLEAINCLDYPQLDILLVDNAPSSDATERLVRTKYPTIRYICEPRPGLDWARNRAISEARGEIIAFTDDDVIVDVSWITALVSIFAQYPEVMAVTGLIVPYELETEAQLFFENYGGFGRGFERKWVRVNPKSGYNRLYHGTGQFGAGANMAFRRSIFDKIGLFDPALDVGTITHGGGDIEMFFRVLKEGYTLVYEPKAIVRHRHRRDYAHLHTQVTNNGIAFASCLIRCALAYPDELLALLLLSLWFLWGWNVRPWLKAVMNQTFLPRDLIEAQLRGFFVGLGRYRRARAVAAQLAGTNLPLTRATVEIRELPKRIHASDLQTVDRS
jgi:O-antigen biosynthesis protein